MTTSNSIRVKALFTFVSDVDLGGWLNGVGAEANRFLIIRVRTFNLNGLCWPAIGHIPFVCHPG